MLWGASSTVSIDELFQLPGRGTKLRQMLQFLEPGGETKNIVTVESSINATFSIAIAMSMLVYQRVSACIKGLLLECLNYLKLRFIELGCSGIMISGGHISP